jgi:chromosome partitioning protein
MYFYIGKRINMIIAFANNKGGVGKTTSAVHLAACLQLIAPTLLLDGDDTRNATAWSQKGEGFPFKVASIEQAAKLSRHYEHTIIDTGQRPSEDELKALMEGCDLLIIPAVPAGLDNDGLSLTINTLRKMKNDAFRVLLTKVPPPPEPQGRELRAALLAEGVPLFSVDIPRLNIFDKAVEAGTTVNKLVVPKKDAPRAARAWGAYQTVAKEVLSHGK